MVRGVGFGSATAAVVGVGGGGAVGRAGSNIGGDGLSSVLLGRGLSIRYPLWFRFFRGTVVSLSLRSCGLSGVGARFRETGSVKEAACFW